MNTVRLADRRCRDFAQADRPYLSLCHQIRHRTHALLDGQTFVPAVKVVQIDDVGPQPGEAVLARLPDDFGATVNLTLPLRIAEHAALAREDELRAAIAE